MDRRTLDLALGVAATVRWLDLYLTIFTSVVGEAPRIGPWKIGLTDDGIRILGPILVWNLRSAPVFPISNPNSPKACTTSSRTGPFSPDSFGAHSW